MAWEAALRTQDLPKDGGQGGRGGTVRLQVWRALRGRGVAADTYELVGENTFGGIKFNYC